MEKLSANMQNKYSEKKLKIMNEALANEINWGDSLLGRLINSAIRSAKVGYKSTKVKGLLESFKAELDGLIAAGLQSEEKNKFSLLLVKDYLSTLESICISDKSDEDKLDELLGAHSNLWDVNKPNGGMWRHNVTSGYMLEIFDDIKNNREDVELKKIGIDKDAFMDDLSNLIDEFRKLTVSASSSNAGVGRTYPSFARNFGNVTNTLSNLITTGYQYHSSDYINVNESVVRFSDFIFEAGVITQNPNQTKPVEKTEVKGKDVKGKEVKASGATNSGSTQSGSTQSVSSSAVPTKLPKDKWTEIKKLASSCKKIQLDSDDKALTNPPVQKLLKALAEITTDDITYLVDKNKNLSIKIDDVDYNLANGLDFLLSNPIFQKIKTDLRVIRSKDSNLQVFKNNKIKPEDKIKEFQKRLALKDKILKKNPNNKKAKKAQIELNKYLKQLQSSSTPKKEVAKNENYVYTFSDKFLFELMGTQSGTSSGTQSGGGNDENRSVRYVFDNFKENIGVDVLFEITQREVDELDEKLSGKATQNLLIDLSKNPDPIIKICRIFQRAQDLYFSYFIPSGRRSGQVSQSTFRNYILLGPKSSGEPKANEQGAIEPGYGPWANKMIFDKWRDGILEIIEDKKYRNILSNVKFVVPGSEDVFNPKSTNDSFVFKVEEFIKILEAERGETDETGKNKKSHGQLLFDFINDMLDKDTAADFDSRRKELLKKYFGQFGLDVSKVVKDGRRTNTPPVNRPPKPEDVSKDSLIWIATNENKFNATDKNKYEGSFYCVPVKKTEGDTEIIFLHALRKINIPMQNGDKEFCIVKFVLNQQKFVDELKVQKYTSKNIETNWSVSSQNSGVYYGIVDSKLPSNVRDFKIVYANVKDGNWSEVKEQRFQVKEEEKNVGSPPKKELIKIAILQVSDNAGSLSKIEEEFDKRISGEKAKHEDNLQLQNNGKKLIDTLKEKAKTYF